MANRQRTKAIAESAGAATGVKAMAESSVVGRGARSRTLTPRQAYELSIHTRKAIGAIADQVAKAHARLFTAVGDEVDGGEAFDFVKNNITPAFVRAVVSWWNLEGEMMAWKVPDGNNALRPQRVIALDPGSASPLPQGVRNPDLVTGWYYTLGGQVDPRGIPSIEIPADQVMRVSNWNPNTRLRGSSPAATGGQEISTNYFANRFNSAFFQNGAMADMIVRFPKGTRREYMDDWVKRYEERHGIFEGKAFKVTAIAGDDLQIESPKETAKDGQFLDLRRLNAEDIGGLWGVPPSVMGFLSKTRFDTIDAELESFAENTLLPQMEIFNAFVNTTLIDPHFRGGSVGAKKKTAPKVGHYLRRELARAKGESNASITFALDPDSLPIMAKVRMRHVQAADAYRRMMGTTFKDAAEWAGVDRASNEADDLIYIDSTQQRVTKEDPALAAAPATEPPPPAKGKSKKAAGIPPLSEKGHALIAYYEQVGTTLAAGGVLTKGWLEDLSSKRLGDWRPDDWSRTLSRDFLDLRAALRADDGVALKAVIARGITEAFGE